MCWLFKCCGSVVVDSLFIIKIVAPIVLCGGEVGRVFDPFCCHLCFFPSFSLFLLHFVVGRELVCDLRHFLPDHTSILFVY